MERIHERTNTPYDREVSYNDNDAKPCGVTLKESENDKSGKFHEIKDELMTHEAHEVVKEHNREKPPNPIGHGDNLTVYARNADNSYKEQNFEYEVIKNQHPTPVQEQMIKTGPSHDVHEDAMKFNISSSQGRGLSEYTMPGPTHEH